LGLDKTNEGHKLIGEPATKIKPSQNLVLVLLLEDEAVPTISWFSF
jgi:hypothetical protein